jgi:hypothetical protein
MMEKHIFSKSLRDLDPAIWSLAREAALGELRNVYYASKRDTQVRIGGWVLLVFGVAFLLFAIIATLASVFYVSLLIALPGFIFLIIGVYLIVPQRIYAYWHVYLWEAGFLYEKGSLRQVFRWDQIESIQGSTAYIEGRIVFNYKVRRYDGYGVKLNNVFLGIAELMNSVLQEFLRQAASQELKTGSPRNRTFTEFKLDRQGISDTQGMLSWQEVEELAMEHGTMVALKRESGFADHEGECGKG